MDQVAGWASMRISHYLDARSMSETAVVRQLTDRLNGVGDITCALCSTLACQVVLISSVMATQPRLLAGGDFRSWLVPSA